jgi:hypothetical protein
MYGDPTNYECPIFDATAGGPCPEVGTRGDLRAHLTRDHREDRDAAEILAYADILVPVTA